MLREEEERIQEHMSILDDDTCACAFDADDAAAAKEANEIGANEIGAEQVRVILSLSPHQHSVRNDGLGSAACRSCRGRRR